MKKNIRQKISNRYYWIKLSIKKCEIRKRSEKIENQVKDQTIDRCKIGQELIKGHNWPKNMCNVNTKNSKMDQKGSILSKIKMLYQ